MKSLKKFKSYIHISIIFLFLLQISMPLYTTMHDYKQIRPRSDTSHTIVVDNNLIAYIAAITHEAIQAHAYDDLSESIKRCYVHINKGLLGLPTDDVITALPDILHYAVEQHKTKSRCDSNLITNALGSNMYDFFITQNPTEKPNNHVITQSITEPGVYYLAENVTGTLVLQSSHVTIKFNGHTLTTASSGGILSCDNNHIRIEGGVIIGASNSDAAIAISNGNDIAITDMSFYDNNFGITFEGVKNFIIHDSRFTNYNGTSIHLANSNNGKIICCQLHNNNAHQLLSSLALIALDNCKHLTCDDIIITENTNIHALKGINAHTIHECRFENIQFTYNAATHILQGISLENCDDNILKRCTINKNIVSSSNNASLIGLALYASIDNTSKSNIFLECQIHDNNCHSTGADNSASFVGIHIAGAMHGNTISNNACAHTIIKGCSVASNKSCSQNADSFFAGINLSGIIKNGSVGNDACTNCTVANCTITKNVSESQGTNNTTQFIGINLAGCTDNCFIGDNSCANCFVKKININNNICTSTGAAFFVGVNLGGIITGGTCTGNNCNNCKLETICISGNTLTNTTASGSMRSINMNNTPESVNHGCNDVSNYLVAKNTNVSNGLQDCNICE